MQGWRDVAGFLNAEQHTATLGGMRDEGVFCRIKRALREIVAFLQIQIQNERQPALSRPEKKSA